MRRNRLVPRPDWREHARRIGFVYADIAGEPYWDETACWDFTAAAVDVPDDSTTELERLALAAADHAVRHNRREMLGIPEAVWPLLRQSWNRREPSLYRWTRCPWHSGHIPSALRARTAEVAPGSSTRLHRPHCQLAFPRSLSGR
jgi:glutathionylspermidine synthase